MTGDERGRGLLRELPLASVLVVLAAGLVIVVYLGHWSVGSVVMGLALCLGAALRLSLPPRKAGLLVARTRTVDAAVLLALGFGLVVLGRTIPT